MKSIIFTVVLIMVLSVLVSSVYGADLVDSVRQPGVSVPPTLMGTGFFEFRCNIDGAGVFLDNNAMGAITNGSLNVPIPVYDRPIKRSLRIEAPGYTVYNETLLNGPKVGETMILRGTLQVLPITLTGSLSLAVSPPGGQVSVDDTIMGIVPQSGIMTLRTVTSGNRIVRVTMPGYQDYSKQLYIEPNMVTKLRITLAPRTTGTLQISSNPSGAQVSINGSPYGITPVTAPDLQQGTYIIGFTMPGYQPYQSQAVLTEGQTIPVSGILQPIPTPTMTPITPNPTPTPAPTEAGLPVGVVIMSVIAALAINQKKE